MRTVTISMRLPQAEVVALEKLAQELGTELGTERPALLKRALRKGAQGLRFERACQAYRAEEATLSRAAELAGLPLRDMILRLKADDLKLSYGVEELAEDLQE
jgi:predicted HTH domain antitoxin